MAKDIQLYGRLFLSGDILIKTGLHIGAGKGGLQIGGLSDNAILRDPLTQRPYVPGSSLKGKMRSLWEKAKGCPQNFPIRKPNPRRASDKGVYIHVCEGPDTYNACPVCPIFGVPGDKGSSFPTRLIVRDVILGDAEAERLDKFAHTDLPYSEIKWEAAIDRVTSAAVPRPGNACRRAPASTVSR